MIITVKSIPVPLDNAPVKSANAARIPIANPPMTVNGIIYLLSICSKTLSSLLNPGICKPDAMIWFACDLASIPEVCTQNIENITAPIAIVNIYTSAWAKSDGMKEPFIILLIKSGEYTQATNPEVGMFPVNVPNKGYPQFSNNLA